jgi:hypothetical protein
MAVPLVSTGWAATEGRTIAGGTELVVRNNEAIEAATASDGKTYSAVFAEDVRDTNGDIAIPKGSSADLVVRKSDSGMLLNLEQVRVNGQTYRVNVSDVERRGNRREGIGKNKRTAEMTGGGAVLGTVLGAIAGGGKGAAIGAIAGGVAGGAAQTITRGKDAKVPPETLLRFRLTDPVRLDRTS